MKIAKILIVIAVFCFLPFCVQAQTNITGAAIESSVSSLRIDPGIQVIDPGFDGDTTNFLLLNDTQLESVDNLTLERLGFGKVIFSATINLTQDLVLNQIDLDAHVQIQTNLIDINTSALTSLEQPATISLYGLTFVNPQILRNGVLCPTSICTVISYTGGNLTFNVSQFTAYSAQESAPPTVIPPAPGSGRGKGAPSPLVIQEFTALPEFFEVDLTQGESAKIGLRITNLLSQAPLHVALDASTLAPFIDTTKQAVLLRPGETRTITWRLHAPLETKPDLYTGRIFLNSPRTSLRRDIILAVNRVDPLLSINASLYNTTFFPGDRVRAQLIIENFYPALPIQIGVSYALMSLDQEIILWDYDNLTLNETLLIDRSVGLFYDITPGRYMFFANVSYQNMSAVSADLFEVVQREKPEPLPESTPPFSSSEAILFGSLIVVFLVLFIWFIKRRKHH